jgi:DNA-binding transcriptional LysR family regulator
LGEQLLGDCRVLLNYASTVGERAQLLQRGDTGVLKVGSSPQVIEGVLAGFLSDFAGHYPNVQVKLVEVLGWPETVAMLERGEIHLGQNLVRAVQPGDPRFGTHPLEPVDLLAAAHPRMLTGESETMEIAPTCAVSVAAARRQLRVPPQLRCRLPPCRLYAERPV